MKSKILWIGVEVALVVMMTVPRTRAEIGQCLSNKHWRKNHLYTVVNEAGQKVPYRQRAVQAEYDANRHGMDVILKSRQHGFSTETEIDILDDALFIPNLQCGIIADSKINAQELFETKIKTPYRALPKIVLNRCPAIKCDGGTLRLVNGSEIRVAVSFRSATTQRLHISEYGKICAKYPQRALEIQTGTLPSIHPQLGGKVTIESTAEGAAGHFYDLCTLAEAETAQAQKEGRPLNPLQFKFHFYPWWRDPKNVASLMGITISDQMKEYFESLEAKEIFTSSEQRAWYCIKKEGAGGLGKAMKREHPSTVQEAFESSVEGAVFSEEIDLARSQGRIGFYPWVQNIPVHTFWDLGYRNSTCVGFVQFIRAQIRVIDYYTERGRGAPYHAAQINHKPYNYCEHHMPHDVMNHEKGSGIVLRDTYQSLLKEPIRVVERPKLKRDSIEALSDMFGSIVFHAPTCTSGSQEKNLIQSLSFYRYEWDENLSNFSKEPLGDWSADPADMMQTLAIEYREGLIDGKRLGLQTPLMPEHVRHSRGGAYRGWNVLDGLRGRRK